MIFLMAAAWLASGVGAYFLLSSPKSPLIRWYCNSYSRALIAKQHKEFLEREEENEG